jgi:L-lactate utilization protein LutC
MTIFNTPRHQRTPETEVDVLLTNLSALYVELHPDAPPHEFINIYFKEMYECEHTSGDVLVEEHAKAIEKVFSTSVYGAGRVTELAALVFSCAFCCQAQRAFDEGRLNEAWTFVVDARHYCSFLLQRSKRVSEVAEIDRINDISRIRTRIVKENKSEKYTKKQKDFVSDMYKSRPWKNKASAIKVIAPALAEYVSKNALPVAKVKCKETGISSPKEDWSRFVEDNLPSAKQVKADAKTF